MNTVDIIAHRLANQGITTTIFQNPQDVVRGLIAMQAQEFAHAKWAIGLRLQHATETLVAQAFTEGRILRTHLMRPTWHFVAPEDIRWLLALTAPRVQAISAYQHRKAGLNSITFKRCNDLLIKILEGGKQLVRTAIQLALQQAGIEAVGQRLVYLLMQAELDGVICSGPRQGKQFTYALLEERVPAVPAISREEALANLVRRYFVSRGPATLQDFVWWSGLTMQDTKAGVAALPAHFVHKRIGDQTYVFCPAEVTAPSLADSTFLLPDYDEYGISYKDRSAIFDAYRPRLVHERTSMVYSHMVVLHGRIAGTWKLTGKANAPEVETEFFTDLKPAEKWAVEQAVERYGAFLQKDIRLC